MSQVSSQISADGVGDAQSEQPEVHPEQALCKSPSSPVETPSVVGSVPAAQDFETLFSLRKLRATSTSIRKEIRLLRARDAVDWLDWFLTLDASLEQLREQILEGDYTPTPPSRYE